MSKHEKKEKAPLDLKKKIIYYSAAAVGGVATALLLVWLILYIVKNPPAFVFNRDDEVKTNVHYKGETTSSDVVIPDAPVTVDGDKQNIEQVVEANDTVEQTKQNSVVVNCDSVDTSGLSSKKKLNFSYLPQNPELPTGCEITSLTSVLNYYGYNVSKTTMADKYLEKTGNKIGNFWNVFVGDPTANGFGCYAKPIVKAANKYFATYNGRHTAVDYSGAEFEELLKIVDDGKPVIIWSTMYGKEENNLREPYTTVQWTINGEKIQWIAPEHCMVLIGFDLERDVAIMADPQRGIAEYDLLTVKARYLALHSQCVILDETPFVEGIRNGDTYYTTQYVDFSDNIKSITVNGEIKTEPFFINGNADKTYELVITDVDGETTNITIYTKPINTFLEPLNFLSLETVTEEYRQLIEEMNDAVQSLDSRFVSAEERIDLDEALEYCSSLLEKIDNIKNELKQIEKDLKQIPQGGINNEDTEPLEQIMARIDALYLSENLTDAQKVTIQDLKSRCKGLLSSIPFDAPQ